MRGLASIVAGRRTKWVILAAWLVAVFAVFSAKLPSKLSDKTTDSTESFLPSSAESTQVVRDLEHQFPQGQTDTGLVVYKNAAGLTPANQTRIAADARAIEAAGNDKIHLVQPPAVPFERGPHNSPGALVSKDGTVAVMVLTTPTNFDKEGDWGKAVRDITDKNTGDMQVYVTGNLGFSADAKVILQAMKTYGFFLTDNGSDWYFQGTMDKRWKNSLLDELKSIAASAFEAVDGSGCMVDPDSAEASCQ